MKTLKKCLFVIVSTGLLLLATACGSLSTEDIVERAVEAQKNMTSYKATVSFEMTFDDHHEKQQYEEWFQQPNKQRYEDETMTIVSNGNKTWMYDATDHSVMIFEDEGVLEEEIPDHTELMAMMISNMMDNHTVELLGQQTIANRSTYHLELQPNEDQFMSDTWEIWIDKETWLPLQILITFEDGQMVTTYEKIEYNVDIDPSIFEFDIPEGAEIKSFDDFMPETKSIEEIRESVDMSVYEITQLPDGYALESAYLIETMVMITYSDEKGNMINLSIMPLDEAADFNPSLYGETEDVTIQGEQAKIGNLYDTHILIWEKEDVHLEMGVYGTDLSQEDLIKLAESIQK